MISPAPNTPARQEPGLIVTAWWILKRSSWLSLTGARWSSAPSRSWISVASVPPSATFISWMPRQMASSGTPRSTARRISGSVVASRSGS